MNAFLDYVTNLWTAFDRLVNAVIGGNPNEKLTSRIIDWVS